MNHDDDTPPSNGMSEALLDGAIAAVLVLMAAIVASALV